MRWTLGWVLVAAGCASTPATTTTASAPENATAAPAAASATPPETASSAAPASPATPTTGATAPSGTPAPASAPASDDLVGKPAPDFTAKAQNGTTVHLAALKGKTVVVYFYPKDETPGCTKEACSFRDTWDAIARTGAVLVGISADSLDSHRKFTAHHKLPFLLVSDPDGAIGKLYGVPFDGVHKRQTIVVGPDGSVRKVYRHVDVTVHAKQILDDLTGGTDAHAQG